jgi:hypothetical protein
MSLFVFSFNLFSTALKELVGEGKAGHLLICVSGSKHPMNLRVYEMEMSMASDTKDPVGRHHMQQCP